MAYSTLPSNPTPHTIAQLLPKLHDADSDLRYMALNDLHHVLQTGSPSLLMYENNLCVRTIDGLLNTLNDSNGEVQNMAVKCLGPFSNRVPESVLFSIIDKISGMQTGNSVDHSIPALALRAIVVALPKLTPGTYRSSAVQEAHSAISKVLIPRLIGSAIVQHGRKDQATSFKGMLETDIETGQDSNAIDVLTEVVRGFGPMLQDAEIQALQKLLLNALESERTNSVLRKKAVSALSIVAMYFSDALLSSFISRLIESFRNPHLTCTKRKLFITVLGSLARSIPKNFGPYLKTLAPFVLSAVSEPEDDVTESVGGFEANSDDNEVKEVALSTLESFVISCSEDMLAYKADCISTGLRFLVYDPNIADDDEEEDTDIDEGATSSNQEDFEEEDTYEDDDGDNDDDDDDDSWKVRRCAARLMYTVISVYNNNQLLDENTLFNKIAPVLISRLKEREESVRLDVLRTLSCLIRRAAKDIGVTETIYQVDTSDSGISHGINATRKRRRGQSDASMIDSPSGLPVEASLTTDSSRLPAQVENQEGLASICSDIGRTLTHFLKKSSNSTIKQPSIVLLKDIIIVQPASLSGILSQLIRSVTSDIKNSRFQTSASYRASSSASVTVNSLRVHALQFISLVIRTQSADKLVPDLDDIIAALTAAVTDRHSRISMEALLTVEQIIAILTEGSKSPAVSSEIVLPKLFDIIVDRINIGDTDSEVRQCAIHAMGFFLSQSCVKANFISHEKEKLGFEILEDKLKKEITRIASARAIQSIAVRLDDRGDVSEIWLRNVSLELAAHLRKANRVLRLSSLQALKAITSNQVWREKLDNRSIREIMGLLMPLFSTNDLQIVNTALTVTALFTTQDAEAAVSTELNDAICTLVRSSVAGPSLDTLLTLIRNIGESGTGKPLMSSLLKDIGVGGHPEIMGKTVGTLLVSGSQTVGVTYHQFVSELRETKDEKRKCLALAILGQTGFLLGPSSTLKPDFFMTYLSPESSQASLSAALALGRAGAGNLSSYLPSILSAMEDLPNFQYHLLHSVKEILLQENTHLNIVSFTKPLWDNIISASRTEDNRAIGAECMGRLAKIDPRTFLPQLQVCEKLY